MKRIAVIGGSRYFGKDLVLRLRDAGHAVTVVNRGSAAVPEGVAHVVADRDDEAALTEALRDQAFDVVLDQVLYTPRQAAAAARVFAGRTSRYVMTSTIEVYDGVAGGTAPLTESAIDLAALPVDLNAVTWEYAEGKRQAEAVLARSGLPYVTVRAGHVLGAGDFTGRLEHYATRARAGEPIVVAAEDQPSSFIHAPEMAAFLHWAADGTFTGPVNACSHGELTATDLCGQIAATPVYRTADPGEPVSPFSFARYYGMDNARAQALGFPFSHVSSWLPAVFKELS
ncbi:NAD-dependent epimerase/dehydratase family protein [Longispora albida]|uniref:NAD-dependent epimerase/dehydratase family protein n=1 Tax=Longispora albida TaxID=203523 RepID=UPI00037C87AD|nr:NAD-dependent epimerase/dehydratase family protein [Longispora albida]